MARVIAIDWSGAAVGAERRIWIAEVLDGELLMLEDAFDAAASALVLSRCTDLAATLAAPLAGDPREGSMLVPDSLRQHS